MELLCLYYFIAYGEIVEKKIPFIKLIYFSIIILCEIPSFCAKSYKKKRKA
jgi:hypothetical protein